jgi:hypothetical protein
MAMTHESARGRCPQCLSRGAVVAGSGGHRMVVPGAQARVSDRAGALATGAAITERRGHVLDHRPADPPYHHGWPGLSRGVLCSGV